MLKIDEFFAKLSTWVRCRFLTHIVDLTRGLGCVGLGRSVTDPKI